VLTATFVFAAAVVFIPATWYVSRNIAAECGGCQVMDRDDCDEADGRSNDARLVADPVSERIPQRFRAEVVRRIGHGGEATVYELTAGRALRVYHGEPHGAGEIAAFYRAITQGTTSFALPQILEQGEDDGMRYSIDRLIPGRPLHELMPLLAGDQRTRALASYTDAALEIASLPCVHDEFGEFLRDDDSLRRGNVERVPARADGSLAAGVPLAAG
jgi:hypothetical protein